MLKAAAQISTILKGVEGAADVTVKQASGLLFLEITVTRAEIARRVRSNLDALRNLPVPLPAVEGRPPATVPSASSRSRASPC